MSDEPSSAPRLPATEAVSPKMEPNEQRDAELLQHGNAQAETESAQSAAPPMPMDVDDAPPAKDTLDIRDASPPHQPQQQQQQPKPNTPPSNAPFTAAAKIASAPIQTSSNAASADTPGTLSTAPAPHPSSPGPTIKTEASPQQPHQHQHSLPLQQQAPPQPSQQPALLSSSALTPGREAERNGSTGAQAWPLESSQESQQQQPSSAPRPTTPPQTETTAPALSSTLPPATSTQPPPQQPTSSQPALSETHPPPSASPPPPPSKQSTAPAAVASEANGYRPLNVKDALTYLDQVKIQFAERPEIYNQFLDIMKDFKSQSIDTPGVIERVSTLFRGHPALISGFNTFLPPGYRIECTVDERSRNVIKVTTPSGTTATTDGEPLILSSGGSAVGYYPQYGRPSTAAYGSQEPTVMLPHSSVTFHHQASQHEDAHTRRTPVEFNHAINYVNKIKNRFASEPDTYKQFLEILQTYQKDQRPIQEVYAQVQTLFNGAKDLLDEFKQFLPETSGADASSSMRALFGGSTFIGKRGSTMAPVLAESTRKKRMSGTSTAGLSKLHKREIQVSDVRSAAADIEEDVEDLQPARATVSAEEAEFFNRVKKYIGNKATYRAFLKLLNLFSQQILDQHLLVTRVESFIGGNRELFEWFKCLVGYDEKEELVENEPRAKNKLDLSQCESYGPSYRRVPKEWRGETCSGRDALCSEVLNDEYLSHPRWASEDSEFVASKKNHFEEALHRVEEERYDYDLSIEANLNTIALLEPISKKISVMSLEEKSAFRLPPGLGGPSKAIYQHVIKKVYGNERGMDIIDLVHSNPVATVPILLKRLKQKDEEWKRAQREWNKIWREVEIRNYFKALDYQGVTFKSSDKKAMSSRSLLSEIENIRNSQPEARQFPKGRPLVVPDGGSRLPPQLSFAFRDPSTFKDVTRLIISFLDRQEVYSEQECKNVRAFIESLIPQLYDLTDVTPDDKLPDRPELEDEGDDDAILDGVNSGAVGDDGVVPSYGENGGPRRRSLRSANNIEQPNGSQVAPEDGHQQSEDVEMQDANRDESDTAMQIDNDNKPQPAADADSKSMDAEKLSAITFFGNDNLYCFLRLFQLVYSRLLRLKQIDAAYLKNPQKTKKENKAAVDLNSDTATRHGVEMDFSHGYYYALLDLTDIFFDGSIDQNTFEGCARYMFGSKAYTMFTIDKLMMLLVRHVCQIIADDQSRQLVDAFQSFRSTTEQHDAQQLAEYKSKAEKDIIGLEENIYGFVFDVVSRILTIQLLDQEDYPLETDARIAYNSYIADFADFNVPTAGLDHLTLRKQFLKRNIKSKRKREDSDAYVCPGMQYKISKESYHMFYIIDTEDAFIRKRKRRSGAGSSGQQQRLDKESERQTQWTAWLESDKGWSRNIEDKNKAESEARALLKGKTEQQPSSNDNKPQVAAAISAPSSDKEEQATSGTTNTSNPAAPAIPSSSSPKPEHPSTPSNPSSDEPST